MSSASQVGSQQNHKADSSGKKLIRADQKDKQRQMKSTTRATCGRLSPAISDEGRAKDLQSPSINKRVGPENKHLAFGQVKSAEKNYRPDRDREKRQLA